MANRNDRAQASDTYIKRTSGGAVALILAGAAGLYGYRKLDAERRAGGKDSLASAIKRRIDGFYADLKSQAENLREPAKPEAAPQNDAASDSQPA